MRRLSFCITLSLLATMCSGTLTYASDLATIDLNDFGDVDGKFTDTDKTKLGKADSCGLLCGLGVDVELAYLKYGQEGGVADIVGSPASFDMQIAPRIEVSYEAASGMGLRGRYFSIDTQATSAAGDTVAVEAYNVDVELYDTVELPYQFDIEGAIGVRGSRFSEFASQAAVPLSVTGEWEGFGGTLGVEARRPCRLGGFYARGRWSLLMGDARITNDTPGGIVPFSATDNFVQQTEIGMGYEVSRSLGRWGTLDARIGAEWQNWSNVAVADTSFGGVGNDDVLEDGGFAGLVFGIGLRR